MILLVLTTSLIVLFSILYFIINWKFNYWKRRNIPYVKPSLPYGNVKDIVLIKKTLGEVYHEIYKSLEGQPLGGFYQFWRPVVMIRDEQLLKNVLVRDFNSFHDNAFSCNEKLDPLMAYNPFAIKGERWKKVRGLHTGTLTGAKLKAMVPLTIDVCKNLILHLEKRVSTPLEAKDLCSTYATDNVASCAFGLQCDSLINEDITFSKYIRRVFENETSSARVMVMSLLLPKLLNFVRLVPKDVSDYFIQVIQDAINYREAHGYVRDDFLQQMIKTLKENGKDFDLILITSQCFGMLVDGFFTTSIAMSFVLYELAMHPEIQENVRTEILSVGQKITDFDYDKVQNLTYLDMVINESLRLHPPVQSMNRVCTKNIKLTHNGCDYNIKKGTSVILPVYSIHMEGKYYPEPEKFIPERFSEEEKAIRSKYVFLPFGEGPRICLGMKFAQLQMKLGLITILLNFNVTPRDTKPIQLDPTGSIFHTAKGGLWLIFNKIPSTTAAGQL